jgi:hypothetical protein
MDDADAIEYPVELNTLDDPEFLAERRRVHTQLATDPRHVVPEEYERIEREFLRRTGMGWASGWAG